MIIAVDFDGTCVTHEFPRIGRDVGAAPILKGLVAQGNQIILFTMRSGAVLDDAVLWFEKNGIPLYGINENPQQHSWTNSPKPYAHIYIDDAALGVPLIFPEEGRHFVDWVKVGTLLGVV